jgi:hypothetical protein
MFALLNWSTVAASSAVASAKPSAQMAAERTATAAQVAKAAAERAKVVEPLFAHVVAEGVLFQSGARSFRCALPA